MAYHNIDATLSDADLQAIRDHFAGVLSKLPFRVNLTVDERLSITKTGPDSLSFVENALATAQANATIFPATFDTSGFARDVNLFRVLTELQALAESVVSQIDDTRLAVGGEAMQAGMQTYTYVKAGAKTTPGLRPAAERLGGRFQKASRQNETDTPDADPSEPKH